MRHPAYRLRKYDAKMDPDAIRTRFLNHRDTINQSAFTCAQRVLWWLCPFKICRSTGPGPHRPSTQAVYLSAVKCNKSFDVFSDETDKGLIGTLTL